MKNKSSDQSNIIPITEEFKDGSLKHTSSKDDDLYHEEDNIVLPIIRIKYSKLPNKGDRWKIFEDQKVLFVVEGSKLNNKERDFLKTVDGVNFLLKQCKNGIKSFNSLKLEIKKKLK